jgi:putative addiction module component (TIGR02574 family)
MSRKPEDIIADALQMPDELPEAESDRLWAEEAERRYADFKAGKIEAVPADEVFARLRSRHQER